MVLKCHLIKLDELEQVMERARSRRSLGTHHSDNFTTLLHSDLYHSCYIWMFGTVIKQIQKWNEAVLDLQILNVLNFLCSIVVCFRLVLYNVTKHAIRVRRISPLWACFGNTIGSKQSSRKPLWSARSGDTGTRAGGDELRYSAIRIALLE